MYFVLSGGGIKGLSLIGFLKALEETNIIPTAYSGASIGAIIAVMSSIGYTSKELYDFIEHFNYDDFCELDITSLMENGGIETGNKIIRLLKLMIKNKLQNPNITFLEHYNKTKKWVIINSACLNTQKTEYFSYKTHPNMYIHTALRMSMSLPFWFKPVLWNDCYYVDGGLLDNFPIQPFIDANIPKHEIIGIKLQNHNFYGDKIVIKPDITSYSLSLWSCIYNEINKNNMLKYTKENYNIFYIVEENMSAFTTDITLQEKIKLFEDGYAISLKCLNNYIESEIMHTIKELITKTK